MGSIHLFAKPRGYFRFISAAKQSPISKAITFQLQALPLCTFCVSKVQIPTHNYSLRQRNIFSQGKNSLRKLFTSSGGLNADFKDFIPTKKELAPRDNFFQQLTVKDKAMFVKAVENYSQETLKRGHIEFIYAALKHMVDFGVERDLEVYKKLLNVFPKGKMIPKNLVQAEFYHFARHQDCALFFLDQMEDNGVIPDEEMKELLLNIFGKSSHVYKRYCRMLYWMPKLKNISPYVLPDPLPDDAEQLAHLAVKRMSVDLQSQIIHFKTEELEESIDKTWIVSSQSPDQMKHIKRHPVDQALCVEGSYLIWLKRISISYFVLRGPPKKFPEVEVDLDDVSDLPLSMFGFPKPPELLVAAATTVHDQEDGTIMAICATGTSSKDSLLSWIRFLQRTNPKLSEIPILFTLRSPPTAMTIVNFNPDPSATPTIDSSEQENVHRKSMKT